jgi:osmotically-inducible protein OsmY
MKKTILILLLGILIGVLGWRYYQRTYHPTVAQRTGELVDRTKETAAGTTQQAATTAKELGGQLGDAGIIALIKGRFLLDRDLSALTISVECTNGQVTLKGTVTAPELVKRAADIARQTKGVTAVTSHLAVKD